MTGNGWFAARPSGTENVYKIYAESLRSQAHLDAIVNEAQEIVNNALGASEQEPRRNNSVKQEITEKQRHE